jgi:hypothetical protein
VAGKDQSLVQIGAQVETSPGFARRVTLTAASWMA